MKPSLHSTSRLTVDQTVPDFKLTDVFDRAIDSARLGDRYYLLVFMRYAGCPWCNLAIHRLALEYPTFQENNCEIVAFMQSSKENIIANIYDRHKVRPEFSIVADPTGALYETFGVKSSVTALARSITKIPDWVHAVRDHGFKQGKMDGKYFLVPAYFLVNGRTRKIVKVDYGTSFYDHDTFVVLYESILFQGV